MDNLNILLSKEIFDKITKYLEEINTRKEK